LLSLKRANALSADVFGQRLLIVFTTVFIL